MKSRSIWGRMGLRGKINVILVPALLPLLTVIVIGYVSHRNSSLSNSERVMELALEGGTRQLTGYLREQAGQF